MSEINLSDDEKKILVKGNGAWHTNVIDGKLPQILMTDGPHGIRKQIDDALGQNNKSIVATCFPTLSALSNSWDCETVENVSGAIAKEARAANINLVLGPGANIKRSPLCGRNFEYFSEDPFLSGTLAGSFIDGLQKNGVGSSLKHFACNNQETFRMTSNSQIDERALREIYLRSFEIAIKKSKPLTVMASYNKINGTLACENKNLLEKILRDEWGFSGAVISDWGASVDLNKSLEAGMDLEMPENKNHFVNNEIEHKFIDRAAKNISNLVKKTISTESLENEQATILEKNRKICEDAECESAVLLKNENILPIYTDKNKKIIIVGSFAKKMRFQGGGSSHINANHIPNAVESFLAAGFSVSFFEGYCEENKKQNSKFAKIALEGISKILNEENEIPVLFFGGLPDFFEGEGFDRKNLSLPENQISLLEKISQLTKKIVFINLSGSAVTFPFEKNVGAILHLGLGGQETDSAVVKLITGEKNPSGKLSETFPKNFLDVPCVNYFGKNTNNVEYRESIFVGYRFYDTYKKDVLFPFGHGLSYTTFEYSNLKFFETYVTIKIKNTGNVFGKEVVQIYVENPDGNFLREKKSLAGFFKVALNPNEEKEISIQLDENVFHIWNVSTHKFIKVQGRYKILAASSSRDVRGTLEVQIEGENYSANDKENLSEYFNQTGETFTISKTQFEKLTGAKTPDFDNVQKGSYTKYNSLEQLSKKSIIAKVFLFAALIIAGAMYKGKSKKDPEVVMAKKTISGGSIECIAGQSGGKIPYKLLEAIILDANGHFFSAIATLLGLKKNIKGNS